MKEKKKKQIDLGDIMIVYNQYKEKYGKDAYKYISKIFMDFRDEHKANSISMKKDPEQSWKGFKGQNLEKVIEIILIDAVKEMGLKIINGNKLKRAKLSTELSTVKENVVIDYDKYKSHLPDADLIVYNPKNFHVLAILSSKATLRERIAQPAYWRLKLNAEKRTKHIKTYIVTPDEDGHTKPSKGTKKKKNYAIMQTDIDGVFVFTENAIEEDEKIKDFSKLIDELQKLKNDSN